VSHGLSAQAPDRLGTGSACAAGIPRTNVSEGDGGQHSAAGLREMERRGNSMLALKYLLMILGAGLFGSAGALVAYDIFLSEQLRRLLSRGKKDERRADVKVRVPRNLARKHLSLRLNFLGHSAGQGLR